MVGTRRDPLSAITGLYDLFDRSYWSRVWAVQEVVIASKINFLCGLSMVSEEYLHHARRLLRNYTHHQQLDAGYHHSNFL
jgi:hypothetical protein